VCQEKNDRLPVLRATQSVFVVRRSEPINTGCGQNVLRFNIIAGGTCDSVGLDAIRTVISLRVDLKKVEKGMLLL